MIDMFTNIKMDPYLNSIGKLFLTQIIKHMEVYSTKLGISSMRLITFEEVELTT